MIGTFNFMANPDFDCQRCKRLNSPEVRSNNRACDKTVKKPVMKHFSGVQFFTCPSNFYKESYAHWIDILKNYQNGSLKFDLDWPNKNYEAIKFLEMLQNRFKADKLGAKNG